MVRKHNILVAVGFALSLVTGTTIGIMHYRHRVRMDKYKELVEKGAKKLERCPDKGDIKQYGSCWTPDQRSDMKEKAKGLAKKGEFLKAGQYYIELGDWVSAHEMAGRANEKDRARLKRELMIRQDVREKACKDLHLDCKKIE